MMMLAGCAPSVKERLEVSLPPTSTVIPSPVPLPPIRPAMDAREALAENRGAAAENKRRLETAAGNYEALRKQYGGRQ